MLAAQNISSEICGFNAINTHSRKLSCSLPIKSRPVRNAAKIGTDWRLSAGYVSIKSLVEHDTKGQVGFFGENLRATYNFGKKVGAVVRENFKATFPPSK